MTLDRHLEKMINAFAERTANRTGLEKEESIVQDLLWIKDNCEKEELEPSSYIKHYWAVYEEAKR